MAYTGEGTKENPYIVNNWTDFETFIAEECYIKWQDNIIIDTLELHANITSYENYIKSWKAVDVNFNGLIINHLDLAYTVAEGITISKTIYYYKYSGHNTNIYNLVINKITSGDKAYSDMGLLYVYNDSETSTEAAKSEIFLYNIYIHNSLYVKGPYNKEVNDVLYTDCLEYMISGTVRSGQHSINNIISASIFEYNRPPEKCLINTNNCFRHRECEFIITFTAPIDEDYFPFLNAHRVGSGDEMEIGDCVIIYNFTSNVKNLVFTNFDNWFPSFAFDYLSGIIQFNCLNNVPDISMDIRGMYREVGINLNDIYFVGDYINPVRLYTTETDNACALAEKHIQEAYNSHFLTKSQMSDYNYIKNYKFIDLSGNEASNSNIVGLLLKEDDNIRLLFSTELKRGNMIRFKHNPLVNGGYPFLSFSKYPNVKHSYESIDKSIMFNSENNYKAMYIGNKPIYSARLNGYQLYEPSDWKPIRPYTVYQNDFPIPYGSPYKELHSTDSKWHEVKASDIKHINTDIITNNADTLKLVQWKVTEYPLYEVQLPERGLYNNQADTRPATWFSNHMKPCYPDIRGCLALAWERALHINPNWINDSEEWTICGYFYPRSYGDTPPESYYYKIITEYIESDGQINNNVYYITYYKTNIGNRLILGNHDFFQPCLTDNDKENCKYYNIRQYRWWYISLVYKNKQLTAYLDGYPIAYDYNTYAGSVKIPFWDNIKERFVSVQIGDISGTYHGSAYVRHITIHSKALTPEEIRELMEETFET